MTIDGVTVDGSNTATPGFKHASGALSLDGTTIDASEGISSYVDVGSITIRNDIVENTAYMGVDFMNGPSFSGAATDHNVVADNLIQNLSDAYGFGVGVCLYDNFYAAVTNNVISNVFVGVQTGNFSQGNPDDAASISQNQISACATGIFYNLMYAQNSSFEVENNTISAVPDENGMPWMGVQLTSIQDPASITMQDNNINGINAATSTADPSSGYTVWNTPTNQSVTISGGRSAVLTMACG